MTMRPVQHERGGHKVVVIGGCHVTGWQIGQSPRFWSHAAKRWSEDSKIQCYGPTSLSKSISLIEQADENFSRSLLILQLGNYEASNICAVSPIIKPLISKLKKAVSRTEAALPTNDKFSPLALSRTANVKIYIRGFVLLGLEWLVPSRIRRKGLTNLKLMFIRCFDAVQEREADKVIVLSTFPTASPVINFYRRQVNYAIKKAAEERSFIYVDAFDALNDAITKKRAKSRSLFADEFHLSALGHAMISDEMVRRLP